MPRGIKENKRRNSSRNESRARGRAMQAAYNSPTTIDKMQRQANALLTLGCVRDCEDGGYEVEMPTVRGYEPRIYRVSAADNKMICTCFEYADNEICQHIFAARLLAERILEDTEIEHLSAKGFINVTLAKVVQAIERVEKQDFCYTVKKLETGKYWIDSHATGEIYTVELNRGIFGVTAHCDCPDFTFTRLGKDEACKHISAVYQFEHQDRVISLKMAA